MHKTLFPYARRRIRDFVQKGRAEADRPGLRDEYLRDSSPAKPPWREDSPEARNDSLIAYLDFLISQDRKSTGLKSVQGQIWQEGYLQGELHGEIYPDVPRALRRWRSQSRTIAIFSSGSILAQKLLFGTTSEGDLLPWLDRHFDTTIGPKIEPSSYTRIAEALDLAPSDVLFVSDALVEISAAKEAGLPVRVCDREGSAAKSSYPVISTFDELFP